MTPYDWLLARRALALGAALGALVFAVMIATDEGTSTLAGRLGRLAAFLALAGAGGAFIATEQARSRGELRALGALGVAPLTTSRGAVVGGAILGALGPVLALVRSVDLSPLFPVVVPSGGWIADRDAWLDATRGVLVRATGDLSLVGPATAITFSPGAPPRVATAVALALAALGFPLWATAREAPLRRAMVGLAVAAASVVAFHWVAVSRSSSLLLLVPPALVVVDAVALHRGGKGSAAWR